MNPQEQPKRFPKGSSSYFSPNSSIGYNVGNSTTASQNNGVTAPHIIFENDQNELRSGTVLEVPGDTDHMLYDDQNNVNSAPSVELKSVQTIPVTYHSGRTRYNMLPLGSRRSEHSNHQSHDVGFDDDNFDNESGGVPTPGKLPPNTGKSVKTQNPHHIPSKAEKNAESGDGSDGGFMGSWCCKLIIVVIVLLLIVILLIIFWKFFIDDNGSSKLIGGTLAPTTLSPTLSPTTPEPTKSPTQFPTRAPIQPTVSPTHSPTKSPTNFPTTSPTMHPTTTLNFVASICEGSTGKIRTSMCINGHEWVRCEKDGSVVMVDGSDTDYTRSCDTGDVCACDTFVRLEISDPCVLASDAKTSQLTCAAD